MNRKEKYDLLLSKVEEGKKEAFISELREAKTKEERFVVVKKYGATLTEEEAQTMKNSSGNELSDEELDKAAGGCSCHCKCSCQCICACM